MAIADVAEDGFALASVTLQGTSQRPRAQVRVVHVQGDVHVLGEPVDETVDLRERCAALEGHRMGGGH